MCQKENRSLKSIHMDVMCYCSTADMVPYTRRPYISNQLYWERRRSSPNLLLATTMTYLLVVGQKTLQKSSVPKVSCSKMVHGTCLSRKYFKNHFFLMLSGLRSAYWRQSFLKIWPLGSREERSTAKRGRRR
jgi:hypothetical protein